MANFIDGLHPGAAYFLADLKPAPILLEPPTMIMNERLLGEYLDFYEAHLSEVEAVVAVFPNLPELKDVQARLSRPPHVQAALHLRVGHRPRPLSAPARANSGAITAPSSSSTSCTIRASTATAIAGAAGITGDSARASPASRAITPAGQHEGDQRQGGADREGADHDHEVVGVDRIDDLSQGVDAEPGERVDHRVEQDELEHPHAR